MFGGTNPGTSLGDKVGWSRNCVRPKFKLVDMFEVDGRVTVLKMVWFETPDSSGCRHSGEAICEGGHLLGYGREYGGETSIISKQASRFFRFPIRVLR